MHDSQWGDLSKILPNNILSCLLDTVWDTLVWEVIIQNWLLKTNKIMISLDFKKAPIHTVCVCVTVTVYTNTCHACVHVCVCHGVQLRATRVCVCARLFFYRKPRTVHQNFTIRPRTTSQSRTVHDCKRLQTVANCLLTHIGVCYK